MPDVIRTRFRDDLRDHGPKGRFYMWKGEGPFISVTNALQNGVPKPALMRWSAKMVAEYVAQNWDEAAELRAQMDTVEFTSLLKNKPWRARDKAADIGSLVHDLAEHYALYGEVTSELPDDPVAEKKIVQVVDFFDTVKPRVWAVEGVVYNRQFGYAGAFDLIAEVPGVDGLSIIDLKTGSGVYAEAALQQTAYRHGEFIAVGDEEVPMPATSGAFCLHIGENGWKLVPVVTDDSSWFAFRAALHIAKWVTGEGDGSEKAAVQPAIMSGRADDE